MAPARVGHGAADMRRRNSLPRYAPAVDAAPIEIGLAPNPVMRSRHLRYPIKLDCRELSIRVPAFKSDWIVPILNVQGVCFRGDSNAPSSFWATTRPARIPLLWQATLGDRGNCEVVFRGSLPGPHMSMGLRIIRWTDGFRSTLDGFAVQVADTTAARQAFETVGVRVYKNRDTLRLEGLGANAPGD